MSRQNGSPRWRRSMTRMVFYHVTKHCVAFITLRRRAVFDTGGGGPEIFFPPRTSTQTRRRRVRHARARISKPRRDVRRLYYRGRADRPMSTVTTCPSVVVCFRNRCHNTYEQKRTHLPDVFPDKLDRSNSSDFIPFYYTYRCY